MIKTEENENNCNTSDDGPNIKFMLQQHNYHMQTFMWDLSHQINCRQSGSLRPNILLCECRSQGAHFVVEALAKNVQNWHPGNYTMQEEDKRR